MFGISTLTSKGQITLPKKVRKHLGIDAGDSVIFEFVDVLLVIRKARNIENYFNTLSPLDIAYKEKLEETIAADIMNDISNILTFDKHFEKLGLQVVSF